MKLIETEKLKKSYQLFFDEIIEREMINLNKYIDEIQTLKDNNDSKNYKTGKLYFDVLKKYNLTDFKSVGQNVSFAYNYVLKKTDYESLSDIKNEIINNLSESHSLEQEIFELGIIFGKFVKKLTELENKPIPVEKLKEVCLNNFLPTLKRNLDITIIHECLEYFLLESLDNQISSYNLPDSKSKELKNRLIATFTSK